MERKENHNLDRSRVERPYGNIAPVDERKNYSISPAH